MDKTQMAVLRDTEAKTDTVKYIHARDFSSEVGPAKTLLYGYDCDRNTWHVYQDPYGSIFLYVYRDMGRELAPNGRRIDPVQLRDITLAGINSLDELIPNKRLYPQYCDFKFCQYLKDQGLGRLPFTTWEEPRTGTPDNPKSVYFGEIA